MPFTAISSRIGAGECAAIHDAWDNRLSSRGCLVVVVPKPVGCYELGRRLIVLGSTQRPRCVDEAQDSPNADSLSSELKKIFAKRFVAFSSVSSELDSGFTMQARHEFAHQGSSNRRLRTRQRSMRCSRSILNLNTKLSIRNTLKHQNVRPLTLHPALRLPVLSLDARRIRATTMEAGVFQKTTFSAAAFPAVYRSPAASQLEW
ncbi:hypothetical protein Q31a_52810 [Aureliella helgolandensis]|uniref:Uncharacterized protein n=1 Tax=Aureliella helgolandensis TaxID=2527968 RepID=A0A518GE72_9BACT|nr:hypothetical protein Q31a_52810 [Aureliella helgolandensis]